MNTFIVIYVNYCIITHDSKTHKQDKTKKYY